MWIVHCNTLILVSFTSWFWWHVLHKMILHVVIVGGQIMTIDNILCILYKIFKNKICKECVHKYAYNINMINNFFKYTQGVTDIVSCLFCKAVSEFDPWYFLWCYFYKRFRDILCSWSQMKWTSRSEWMIYTDINLGYWWCYKNSKSCKHKMLHKLCYVSSLQKK